MSDFLSSLDPAIKSALAEKSTDHEPGGYSGNPFFGARADFCARVAERSGRAGRHPAFLGNTMVGSAHARLGDAIKKIVMRYEGETDSDVETFFEALAQNYDELGGEGVGLELDEYNEDRCHIFPVDANGEWLGGETGMLIDLTDKDNEILSKFLEKRLRYASMFDDMDEVKRDEPAVWTFLSRPSGVKAAYESDMFDSEKTVQLATVLHTIDWNSLERSLRTAIRRDKNVPLEEKPSTCSFLRTPGRIVATVQYASGNSSPMIELKEHRYFAIVDNLFNELKEDTEDINLKNAMENTWKNIKNTSQTSEPFGADSSYSRPKSLSTRLLSPSLGF